MEGNFQGDLADVVRAGGGGVVVGDASISNFPVVELPLDELSEGFGDPFSSMKDPLLMELEGIGHCGSSTSSTFHGDFIGEMRDESTGVIPAAAFQISCTSDNSSNNNSAINMSDDQMRISCDLRGFTPGDLRGASAGVSDSLMNPSSPKALSSFIDTSRVQISSPRNPIPKRRKGQAKKVVCIPAPTAANSRQGGGEVVPCDLWAWRKYGQKPIKGSPYPRGYYRCSSSKGCSARKQVERSRTDPNMLVITYTSEHNHPRPTQRNSLAGSSRVSAPATSPPSKPSSPPLATTGKGGIDPHQTLVSSMDSSSNPSEEKSIVEADVQKKGNDVVVPSQLMMNELVFDYDNSYRPVMQEEVTNKQFGGSDLDLFADLRGLEESDPLNLLFSREFMRANEDTSAGENKSTLVDVDDPFGSLFDWSSNSNATTTTKSDRHQNNS